MCDQHLKSSPAGIRGSLISMRKALGSVPAPYQLDLMAQACDPSLEVEEGRSGVQSHLQLCREFKASLSYRQPSLKKKKKAIRDSAKNEMVIQLIHAFIPTS